jgi:hypothetical protein
MDFKSWYQSKPWRSGLVWGWTLFSILTFIDYWNGELEKEQLLFKFIAWTIGGILFGYFRKFLLDWAEKRYPN